MTMNGKEEVGRDEDFVENLALDVVGLTEDELLELKGSEDMFHVFAERLEERWTDGGGFDLYASVGEFGKENSNDLRDEDEDDEDFGDFLIDAYGNDGKFAFEFRSGRVLAESE